MIEIGSRIFLQVIDDDVEEEQSNIQYRCRLVDQQKSYYIIDYPINEETNKQGFFLDGTQLLASYFGDDGVMYSFETKIVGRTMSKVPVLILIKPDPNKVKRIQRRSFVRVETDLPVEIQFFNAETEQIDSVQSVMHDVSGGGCAVTAPEDIGIEKDDEIAISFSIPIRKKESHEIKTACKVIRFHTIHEEAPKRMSLQFLTISDADRQKIVQYCFERQLTYRRLQNE